MFVVFLLVLSALLAWMAVALGPRAMLATACGMSIVVPTWVQYYFGAATIDLRVGISGVAIALYAIHPLAKLPKRLVVSDVVVIALLASICVSEWLAGSLSPTATGGVLIVWLLPYVLGRCVVVSADADRITSTAVAVTLVVATWALIEATTGFNLTRMLTGQAGSLQGATEIRWGLKRVEGPATHPIFFGMIAMLAMPWMLAAASRARRGDGPAWWRFAPWFVAAAVICSMSRGPQIATLLVLFVVTVCRVPQWRVPLLGGAAIVAAALFIGRDYVLQALHTWSGESEVNSMTIVIDGHSYDYTGTNHRLLLLRVYADAIAHAGWFGFGTPKVSGDTTHVPFVEDQLRSLFASIDNHYVQFVLQAGYLGVGLFVVLGAVSAGYLLPPALAIDHRRGLLAAGLFGAIVATMFSLMTVWLSRDFSFFWLLLVGVAGAWRSEILTERAMSLARRPTNVLQRRLVPGHALPIAAPG